ncbi:holin family protein [Sphingomicrobium lutaoense]|uniref:Holin of 3TMs, for gene-transfer release n=1 Tax=Sphingomicrobium lutaoense TaxID=515949 RepID=A0A839Z4G7_9SPHN|nr:holin family protein [Sphingomicrobium lutaoense]MBB3764502.1 hypothetical protein [Sphingomicrobium lutaoense]
MTIVDALIGPVSKLLDKLIPDKEARARAKLELIELQGRQELEELNLQLSAIIAEARSADSWTSRARPSFMYVMYLLILFTVPMGVISAFEPEVATGISTGMTAYLRGIPESLYALFGTGYLGYTAARTYGKVKGVER